MEKCDGAENWAPTRTKKSAKPPGAINVADQKQTRSDQAKFKNGEWQNGVAKIHPVKGDGFPERKSCGLTHVWSWMKKFPQLAGCSTIHHECQKNMFLGLWLSGLLCGRATPLFCQCSVEVPIVRKLGRSSNAIGCIGVSIVGLWLRRTQVAAYLAGGRVGNLVSKWRLFIVGSFCHLGKASQLKFTWLILPVVICLSQRLSHACLSLS